MPNTYVNNDNGRLETFETMDNHNDEDKDVDVNDCSEKSDSSFESSEVECYENKTRSGVTFPKERIAEVMKVNANQN